MSTVTATAVDREGHTTQATATFTVSSGVSAPQIMAAAGPDPTKTLTQVPAQATSGTGWHWDASNSSIRIDTAGANLTQLDVAGGVLVNGSTGNPYTATDCRFRCTGWADASVGVYIPPGSTLTRCEVGGGADGKTWVRSLLTSAYGTAAKPIVFDHCNIHHGLHGIHHGGYVTVKWSWLHDESLGQAYNNGQTPNPQDHTDGTFWDYGHFVTYVNTVIAGSNNSGFFGQNYAKVAVGNGDITFDTCWFFTDMSRPGAYGSPPNYGLNIENKMINGPGKVTNCVFDLPVVGGVRQWGVRAASVPVDGSGGQTWTVSGNKYVDGSPADQDFARVPVVY